MYIKFLRYQILFVMLKCACVSLCVFLCVHMCMLVHVCMHYRISQAHHENQNQKNREVAVSLIPRLSTLPLSVHLKITVALKEREFWHL